MELQRIRDENHLDLILDLDEAVIYKHGPMCWMSMIARRHLKKFSVRHPEVPVFFVNAVAQRPLSTHIAGLLRIRHESPQAILLVGGRSVWDASHYRVTAGALERNLTLARSNATSVAL
jgi:bacillithiol system protein YtxJ